MSRVAVVTDSIACLPAELVKEYGIRIIPLTLSIDGKAYKDQIDISADEFWKLFPFIKRFSTSAPTVDDFQAIFREVAEDTDSLACAVVSKALSATYQVALQAREAMKKENPGLNIEVVDTKIAVGGQGFVALEAARAARAGKSLAEVISVMENTIGKVKSIACLDTLRYLIRSGRAPKTAYVADLLDIKAIIGMVRGTGLVNSLGRARGKNKCAQRLVEMVGELTDITKPLHVMVHYTDKIEDGKRLMEAVKSKYNCAEIYLTPYSILTSGHSGPLVSISFFS